MANGESSDPDVDDEEGGGRAGIYVTIISLALFGALWALTGVTDRRTLLPRARRFFA